jgi:hypothetical protein
MGRWGRGVVLKLFSSTDFQMSPSQVARITGVYQQCPVSTQFFEVALFFPRFVFCTSVENQMTVAV